MTSRKYNEYLDFGSEKDEDSYHNLNDLEDAEDSKFSRLRKQSSKRQRLDLTNEAKSGASEEEEEEQDGTSISSIPIKSPVAESLKSIVGRADLSQKNLKLKPLTPAQLAVSQRKARKTGVVYLSRIPPFMRPSTIRHLLEPYGAISRLFLTPEPPATYTRRVKAGGNKKRSFIDGWVEFASKKDAKICAETLNGEIIGGKKGGWYHDDLWNIKYLRGFKWGDLMEQVQREEREREGRMRAEVQREARERKAFLVNVEAAKRERGMEAKRKKAKGDFHHDIEGKESRLVVLGEKEPTGRKGFERRFRQNKIRVKDAHEIEEQPDDVKRVLSKIF